MMQVAVMGKIVYEKSLGRYFFREKTPRKVLIILNQNPEAMELMGRCGNRARGQGIRGPNPPEEIKGPRQRP
jgi:hypothetical protein